MKSVKTPTRLTISIALLASVLVILAFVPYPQDAQSGDLPDEIKDLLIKVPVPVRPFELIDQGKKPFNTERLKGAWTLMFFGYTLACQIIGFFLV